MSEAPTPTTYLASLNSDGLGVRLGVLSNVIAVAKKTSLDYRFVWPAPSRNPHHGIPLPEEVFAKGFCNRIIEKSPQSWSWIHETSGDSDAFSGAVRVPLFLPPKTMTSLGLEDRDLTDAWNLIEFSESAMAIASTARTFRLDSTATTVVHIRGGDVMAGYWGMLSYHWRKVVTIPVLWAIEDWLASLEAGGEGPLAIFSQDKELGEVLEAAGYEVHYSSRHEDEAESFSTTFLDLNRISHFDRIISGTSGFTVAAARATGAELFTFHSHISNPALVEKSMEFLESDLAFQLPKQAGYVFGVLLGPLGSEINSLQLTKLVARAEALGIFWFPAVQFHLGVYLAKRDQIGTWKNLLQREKFTDPFNSEQVKKLVTYCLKSTAFTKFYGLDELNSVMKHLST